MHITVRRKLMCTAFINALFVDMGRGCELNAKYYAVKLQEVVYSDALALLSHAIIVLIG